MHPTATPPYPRTSSSPVRMRRFDFSSTSWRVHVYVEDVDATYHRALAHGATSVQPPIKKDDPDKRGGVKDAGGTPWWIR